MRFYSWKMLLYIISHSHWDHVVVSTQHSHHACNWVELFDNLLIFLNDPGSKDFHLDGQTIVLTTIEIRPENRDKGAAIISRRRASSRWSFLYLAGWLPDLSKTNVRNTLIGQAELSVKWAKPPQVVTSQIPFGNGQAPQRCFKNQVHPRSSLWSWVKWLRFDNQVLEDDSLPLGTANVLARGGW